MTAIDLPDFGETIKRRWRLRRERPDAVRQRRHVDQKSRFPKC